MTEALEGRRIEKLALGHYHTCALADDGVSYCWGMDSYGQLGDGADLNITSQPGHTAVAATALKKTVISDSVRPLQADSISIESYGATSCAMKDGVPYCWGYNLYGQLPDSDSYYAEPVVHEVKMTGALEGKNYWRRLRIVCHYY